MNKKNILKFRKNKGITLIALVITIIVLLILAGVSISMLSGSNGVLQKVTEAKQKNEKATEKERVQLVVQAALTDGLGTVNLIDKTGNEKGSLKKALDDEFGIGNYELLGGIIEIGENEYQITSNGQVTEIENTPLVADTTETASWAYSDTDGEGQKTELAIVGYKGTIPEDGVLTIPSVLTIDGEKKEIKIISGVFNIDNFQYYTGACNFSVKNPEKIKKIKVSYGIEKIDGYAFSNESPAYAGLTNLQEVVIPKSVTSMGFANFSECTSLKSVTVFGEMITGFRGCSNLINVLIGPNVSEIGDFAFTGTSINNLDLSNITKIGPCAFINSKIEKIELPNCIFIGYAAFSDCERLVQVILPDIDVDVISTQNIFGDVGTQYSQSINYIKYRGTIYTSVSEFYDAL